MNINDFKNDIKKLNINNINKILDDDLLNFSLLITKDNLTQEKTVYINEILSTSYSIEELSVFACTRTKYFLTSAPNSWKNIVLYDYENSTNFHKELLEIYKSINLKLSDSLYNDFFNILDTYKENIYNNIKIETNPNINVPKVYFKNPNYHLIDTLSQLKELQTKTYITTNFDEQNEKLSNDLEIKKEDNEPEKTLDELLEELNSLTGLNSVKTEINKLIDLIKINKMREENGLLSSNVSKHMVFSGNPGTGKTTVARLLSKIYKSLGLLSKGQLIETDRSGLVAGYVGQTAIKTKEIISNAIGGVLFIDEAYTLNTNSENDFGQEAIDTLLKEMEDNRDDLVVVVAGYPDLMNQFLNSNPGLQSRFNKFIYFEDYQEDELFDILLMNCKKLQFELSDNAKKFVKKVIKDLLNDKPSNFGNAREMRNYLEYAIQNQATRLSVMQNVTKDDLILLKKEDFEDFIF